MPETDIRVTLRDVHEAVVELTQKVNELSTLMRIQAAREEARQIQDKERDEKVEDVEGRVRVLEKMVWALPMPAFFLSLIVLVITVLA